MSTDSVRVVFRNQSRKPVHVIINGLDEATNQYSQHVLTSVVAGMSGVFTVSGYSSYQCSAICKEQVNSPYLPMNAKATFVFLSEEGLQK